MRIVEAAGELWSYVGWGLFVGVLLVPFAVPSMPAAVNIYLLCFWGLILWWLIDAASQMVPTWLVLAGLAICALGCFNRFALVIGWAIYWTKVRE